MECLLEMSVGDVYRITPVEADRPGSEILTLLQRFSAISVVRSAG